ncbi:hypothetical protein [Microcoleus sp. bin38.metabat.b11b12b14.051]|uniref:hypothetical protein n=1 Tax=Microcoleus sp. bin38.metabat.b11b12b14.051 TaxID=2742709 RepID=UPI0025D059E6|nr:hypothetical protein [Microcoleus sp. bin38.metabat.b11b12b14.051]
MSGELRQNQVFLLLVCDRAIAQNKGFIDYTPVRDRDEKQPVVVRSNRCDRQIQLFPR